MKAHGHNTLGENIPGKVRRMKSSISQAMGTNGSEKAPEGFFARLRRWADEFDYWFDNTLLVFKPGTPWELTKQIAVKLITIAVAVVAIGAFLVLMCAM